MSCQFSTQIFKIIGTLSLRNFAKVVIAIFTKVLDDS
jgi:hypothetical protein